MDRFGTVSALGEEKVTGLGVISFHEHRAKNDGIPLFQNRVLFLHHPIYGYFISSLDIDNAKVDIILPSGY